MKTRGDNNKHYASSFLRGHFLAGPAKCTVNKCWCIKRERPDLFSVTGSRGSRLKIKLVKEQKSSSMLKDTDFLLLETAPSLIKAAEACLHV